MSGVREWPEPDYPGATAEVHPDTAQQLLVDVPADQRLYTMAELLEMFGSWGWPMEDAPDQGDIESYVEHMAAGGYVIGRPPRPMAMNVDLFRYEGLNAEQLRDAIDFARDHGWFEREEESKVTWVEGRSAGAGELRTWTVEGEDRPRVCEFLGTDGPSLYVVLADASIHAELADAQAVALAQGL